MSNKNIKIYGLMRSGTNFLEFLIRNNYGFVPLVNQAAWKHGKIACNLDAHSLIIYKEIYSWLYSIYNYALKTDFFDIPKDITLSQFIRRKFVFNENNANLQAKNPIVFYNERHDNYLNSEVKNKKIFIRYERLLSDTKSQLEIIAKTLDISFDSSNIVYPIKNILPHQTATLGANKTFNYEKKSFYEQEQYKKYFSKLDEEFIMSEFNESVMNEINKLSI